MSVGDHVGWGYLQSSCGHCEQCLTGTEQLCREAELYSKSNLDQGSYATYGIWKADYVFAIPESMAPEEAAPLMCGGATVFRVLHSFGILPTDRVGVIGVGGLGHLAIQFASKMGCEVVVLSGTDSKKDEAFRLGASEFVAIKGRKTLNDVIKTPLNHLLVTTSVPPDSNLVLPIMAPRGVIYPVTVSEDQMQIPYAALIMLELRVQGSLVAPRQVHRDMLRFAARHAIRPVVETFPMTVQGITEAMDRLNSGNIRYRGVLTVGA